VFPAINLSKTGTRRDELLYSAADMACINKLRRAALATTPPQAIEGLLKLLEKYPTNEELLKSVE
jgi:transcription termination factor Rho